MSNTFFNHTNRFVKLDTVRAEDVNAVFDEVATGLDGVQTKTDAALKLPAGETPAVLPAPGARANKVLTFDASGAPVATYPIADVTTVAGIAPDVTAVANVAADVALCADNLAAIQNAPAQASAASASAAAAAGSAATASANAATVVSLYDAFDDRYLGSKTSDPGTDNDGNALINGAMYFNTTISLMRVYNGATWQDASSSVNGTANRYSYTATAGQTTFAASYDVGFVDVYLNGLRLINGADYTASDTTTVVLSAGAAVGDSVEIIGYGNFTVDIPLPAMSGNAGKFVTTDGFVLSWQAIPEQLPFSSNAALAQAQAIALSF